MKNTSLLLLVAFLNQFWTRCLSPASSTKAFLLLLWPLQRIQDLALQMWYMGRTQDREAAGRLHPWVPPVGPMGLSWTAQEQKTRRDSSPALSWSSLRKPTMTWPRSQGHCHYSYVKFQVVYNKSAVFPKAAALSYYLSEFRHLKCTKLIFWTQISFWKDRSCPKSQGYSEDGQCLLEYGL